MSTHETGTPRPPLSEQARLLQEMGGTFLHVTEQNDLNYALYEDPLRLTPAREFLARAVARRLRSGKWTSDKAEEYFSELGISRSTAVDLLNQQEIKQGRQ